MATWTSLQVTYFTECLDAKKEASEANSNIQKLKMRLTHLEKELKADEPKARQAKKDNQALVNEMESNKKVLEMVTVELS